MLRPAGEEDVQVMLAWRNQPMNRQVSTHAHVITEDEHLAWWIRTKGDPSRRVLVFEHDGVPRGIVNFYDLTLDDPRRSGSFGSFLNRDTVAPEGANLQFWLLRLFMTGFGEAVDYGFEHLNLDVIHGIALADNRAGVAAHRRHGFTEGVAETREVDGRAITVVPFSLHREGRGRPARP